MTSIFVAGVGVASLAMAGRFAYRAMRQMPKESAAVAGRTAAFYEGAFENPMSRKEALLILNIKEGARKEEVKVAHRRLMMINHPDTGGSVFLSTKVNEAKEVLVQGRGLKDGN